MPYIKLQTNVQMDETRSREIVKKLSSHTAAVLGKPEAAVQAILEPLPHMLFGGKEISTAFIDLRSVGLGSDKTPETAAQLGAFCREELGIEEDQAYISFTNISRDMWGFKGSTL